MPSVDAGTVSKHAIASNKFNADGTPNAEVVLRLSRNNEQRYAHFDDKRDILHAEWASNRKDVNRGEYTVVGLGLAGMVIGGGLVCATKLGTIARVLGGVLAAASAVGMLASVVTDTFPGGAKHHPIGKKLNEKLDANMKQANNLWESSFENERLLYLTEHPALLKDPVDSWFNSFDHNQDGVIDLSPGASVSTNERFVSSAGGAPQSERETFSMFPGLPYFDSNRDNKLTRAEATQGIAERFADFKAASELAEGLPGVGVYDVGHSDDFDSFTYPEFPRKNNQGISEPEPSWRSMIKDFGYGFTMIGTYRGDNANLNAQYDQVKLKPKGS